MKTFAPVSTGAEPTVGSFLELGSCNVMECMTRVGLDYVIIDTEHGNIDMQEAENYIRTAELGDVMPLVRIPNVVRNSILRALDAGARGLIVPNIRSVEEVKELVSHAKFPPIGNRGYCPTRTTVWGADSWGTVEEYMAKCNERVAVIPQCETAEALACIEDIAALDGVDGIFVGPCDLSLSLGVPLQFDNPILLDGIQRVIDACHAVGKFCIVFAGNPADAKKWFNMGADSVTYSLDATIFVNAFRAAVAEVRP